MNCRQCREYFSHFIDAPPDDDLRQEVEVHLTGCERCRVQFREYHTVMEGLESMHIPEPSADMEREMWRDIRQKTRSPAARLRSAALLIPAGIAFFMAGFLLRGLIDSPSAIREPSERSAIQYAACSALFHNAYPINPNAVYDPADESMKSVNFVENREPLRLPAMLSSHGPFSLQADTAETETEQACIPFVSPSGQTLVLRVIPHRDAAPETLFQLSREASRVFYHRISWHHDGFQWILEGRVRPDFLFDLASELKSGVGENV